MRHKWLAITMLAIPVLWTGCMRQVASTPHTAPDYMSVPVRFVMAPEPEPLDVMDVEGRRTGVIDASYEGFVGENVTNEPVEATPRAYHVALWGGPFEGTDVTTGVTLMTPGSYTFAFFDQEKGSSMQGWVDVRNTGDDVLDILYRWKDGIPQQKQRVAYELELTSGLHGNNPTDFESLSHQLAALDELERRIDQAIMAEREARGMQMQHTRDFLREAEVLLVPGKEAFFRPTTEPAFTEEDVENVNSGQTMTKLVLVADHNQARWKLRRVNELYGDLVRCKEVFREEVDRLERRKGLFLLTDHLHRHDKRFVENEIQLQHALGCLARLDEDLSDLRDRRTALAFITGLFSTDGTYRALDEEHANLKREFAVLEAEQRRITLLFDEIDDSSVRKVALERRRQRVMAGIDSLNRQLEELGQAREALVAMSEFTNVIHRQGDTRLLTAALVDQRMPFNVRDSVEREAVMTVRLEASDEVYVPTRTSVTTTETGTTTTPSSQNRFRFGDQDSRTATETRTQVIRTGDVPRPPNAYTETRAGYQPPQHKPIENVETRRPVTDETFKWPADTWAEDTESEDVDAEAADTSQPSTVDTDTFYKPEEPDSTWTSQQKRPVTDDTYKRPVDTWTPDTKTEVKDSEPPSAVDSETFNKQQKPESTWTYEQKPAVTDDTYKQPTDTRTPDTKTEVKDSEPPSAVDSETFNKQQKPDSTWTYEQKPPVTDDAYKRPVDTWTPDTKTQVKDSAPPSAVDSETFNKQQKPESTWTYEQKPPVATPTEDAGTDRTKTYDSSTSRSKVYLEPKQVNPRSNTPVRTAEPVKKDTSGSSTKSTTRYDSPRAQADTPGQTTTTPEDVAVWTNPDRKSRTDFVTRDVRRAPTSPHLEKVELGATHPQPVVGADDAVDEDDLRLATYYEDVPGQRTDDEAEKQADKEKDKDKQCPLLIRLLVPPCWFLDK